MNMTLRGWHACEVGKVRQHNEDRFYGAPGRGLFVVCDGMGGHSAGEVAAELACKAVASAYPTAGPVTEATVRLVVDAAAMAVAQAALTARKHHTEGADMGATIVLLAIRDDGAIVAHAGDSRCYFLRAGTDVLSAVTKDHNVIEEAIGRGVTPELVELIRKTSGNLITNGIGMGYRGATSTTLHPIGTGDAFLLCSDGLHGMISDKEIVDIMVKWRAVGWETNQPSPWSDVAEALCAAANEAGGKDNVTAAVVVVG